MRFDVHGRFQIEIVREGDQWVAYRLDLGKRMKVNVVIPQDIQTSEEIARYLDDLYHEAAGPGQSVSPVL